MRQARLLLPVLPALLLVATRPAHADDGATQTVERLNAVLKSVLADAEQLGYRGRFDRLAPAMAKAFDMDFTAEKALGRHWKDLSDAQKMEWREVFREFMIANYAANLDRNAGQKFEVLGEDPDQAETVLVRTRVVEPTAEPVNLTYRLRKAPDGWRIIDVQLKGTVSELALRRADFSSVVDREGFDALVRTVRSRIADLAAGRGKRPAA